MSKQSYIDGFCKKAAENGLDPKVLAQFAVYKKAQDSAAAAGSGGKTELWAKVMEALKKAKGNAMNAVGAVGDWYDRQNQAVKALIGAGLGSAAGTGLGAALYGKKGLRGGAILGAVGGGLGSVDWKALSESFDKLKKEYRANAAAEQAASDAAKAAVNGAK